MSYNLNMPRILLIMRHAKSSWDDYDTDFERPLNKRGQRAAKFMGKFMKQQGLIPDAIVSSPAERALSTAELVASRLELEEIFQNDRIYGANSHTLLQIVNSLDNAWEKVLLIGHNPGLEDLVDDLTGSRDTILRTASMAVLSVAADSWDSAGMFEVVTIYHPRELMDEE